MPSVIKSRITQNEISDYIYTAMNVHDASGVSTPRQIADGLAALVMTLADRFGIDCTIDRFDTVTKLAKHFGVTFYAMKRALQIAKIPGKQVAGTSKVTYSRQHARQALIHSGYISS
jgi:hypothetical protein